MSAALPPGPRTPALVQTVDFFSRRFTAFPRLRRRYGDTFSLHVFPGPERYVIFSRPEDIREIFSGRMEDFAGAPGNEVLRAAMGDHSIILSDGQTHHAMRRYLMPAFSPRAVSAHQPIVQEIVRETLSAWPDRSSVYAHEECNAITLDVMLELVFGTRTGSRIDQLRPRLLAITDISPLVAIGWMYDWIPRRLPPWRGPQRNLEAMDRLIYAEIADRRTTGFRGSDMLSHLLEVRTPENDGGPGPDQERGLSDSEIRDQLITLLLAGYETTSAAVAWTLHELARHPAVQRRAQQAADEGDTEYLDACLKEGMRRHPVTDFVVRRLETEHRIGRWDLPAGTFVVPAIMLVHGDARLHPEPETFHPERFLPEATAAPAAPRGGWVPFGGGVRRCVGAAMAHLEGGVMLQEVLSRFDLTAVKPAPTRLRNINNVPADGAPVQVTHREVRRADRGGTSSGTPTRK